jgi:hypothetical protein
VWILVTLLVLIGPLPCQAGEGFLDRSKVHEAVPYGTTIEQRPSKEKATPHPVPERESGRPNSTAPGSTIPEDGGRAPDRQ